MTVNRIVSFLPSATELLYELGVQDNLYGVTHECQFPEDARQKPCVIRSVIESEKLTSNEINQQTCQLLTEKKDIFILDEEAIKTALPDLIISQETCEVCAAYNSQVNKALQILNKKPMVYSMNPHNLEEIIESVTELGKILQKSYRAKEITDNLRNRIQNVTAIKKRNPRPKVLAIEWLEPLFTAGHWVPELVEIAGGKNMISVKGEHSRRLNINDITRTDPDIVILMPCGFSTTRTVLEYNTILKENKRWNELRAVKKNEVYCVDAKSFFSKPSIRTITGMEIITKIIQPENSKNLLVPKDSFVQMNCESIYAVSNLVMQCTDNL